METFYTEDNKPVTLGTRTACGGKVTILEPGEPEMAGFVQVEYPNEGVEKFDVSYRPNGKTVVFDLEVV